MAENYIPVGEPITADQLPTDLQAQVTGQPVPIDPVDVEDIPGLMKLAVDNPDTFSPAIHARANQERFQSDPAYREKLNQFNKAMVVRGFEFEDIDLVKGAKALGHMATGLQAWGEKMESSIGKVFGRTAVTPVGKKIQKVLGPVSGLGGAVATVEKLFGAKETPEEKEKRFKEAATESAEALSSFEAGASGTVEMVGTGGKKLWRMLPGTRTPKEWTSEEAEADLLNKISKLDEQEAILAGRGEGTQALIGSAIQDLGIEVDPEKVAQLSDPVTFFAIPGGFALGGKIAGKAVQLTTLPLRRSQAVQAVQSLNAARTAAMKTAQAARTAATEASTVSPVLVEGATAAQPTLGAPIIEKAVRTAVEADKAAAAVAAAERTLAELPAGQKAVLAGVQAFNKSREGLAAGGQAIRAGVDRGLEVATGAGIMGAGYGLHGLGALSRIPRIIQLPIPKGVGTKMIAAGKSLATEGTETWSPWAALTGSAVKGGVDVGLGATKGLLFGDIPFTALVSESPGETANFPLFATAMGVGAGGRFGAQRFIVEQAKTQTITDAAMKITAAPGSVASLNRATEAAAAQAKPEQVRRFAALRVAAAAMGTELYWAGGEAGPSGKSPYRAALEQLMPGYTKEWYDQQEAAPGVTIERSAPDPKDPTKRVKQAPVILVKDPGTSRHEFTHAVQVLLGDKAMERVRAEVVAQYGDQWDSRGIEYVKRFKPDLANYYFKGETWREALMDIYQPGWRETYKTPADMKKMVDQTDLYLNDELSAEVMDFVIKNQGPDLARDTGLPGMLARTLAKTMQAFGTEPFPAGTETAGQAVPLTYRAVEGISGAMREAKAGLKADIIAKGIEKGGLAPEVKPATATEAVGESPADKAIRWVNEKAQPTDKTRAEAVQQIVAALRSGQPVRLSYFGAKGEPGGSAESMRPDRRAEIEAGREASQQDKVLVTKDFWPTGVNVTNKGPQFQGWSVDNFTANVNKFGNWLKDASNRGIPLPAEVAGLLAEYGIDPVRGITPENWNAILADAQTFSRNQLAGFTGSGKPVVLPKGGIAGYEQPALTGTAATPLNQSRADFINYMLGLPLAGEPGKAPVIRDATKVPLDVAGMEIAAKTGAAAGLPGRVQPPVFPRKTYGEGGKGTREKAAQLGIEGVSPQEVNPFRRAVEQTSKAEGVAAPSLIEVSQRLNFKDIGGYEGKPEGAPDVRANVLTTKAGFQAPSTQLERAKADAFKEVHPAVKDGKNWRTFQSGTAQDTQKVASTPFVANPNEQIYIPEYNFQGEKGPGVNILARNPLFLSDTGWLPEGAAKDFFEKAGLNQIPNLVPFTAKGSYRGKDFIWQVNNAIRAMERQGMEAPSWTELAERAGYDAIFVDGKPSAPEFILASPDKVLHAGEPVNTPSAYDYYAEPVAKQVRADIEALTKQDMSGADFVKTVDSLIRRLTLSSGAENIGKFQAPKLEADIARVRESKDLNKDFGADVGGPTGFAYRMAAMVQGGRDIKALQDARNFHAAETQKARAEKDFDRAVSEATKAQIMREAMEAAQDIGSAKGALPEGAPLAENKAHTEAGKALEEKGWSFSEQHLKREDGAVFNSISLSGGAGARSAEINYLVKPDGTAFVDYVITPVKGQGIGTALYREMLTRLQAQGIRVLEGNVVAPEALAIRKKLLGEPTLRGKGESDFQTKPTSETDKIGVETWATVRNLIPGNVLFQAPPKKKGEYVKGAAVKFDDGKVFTGESHYDAIVKGQAFYDSKGIRFNDQPQPVDEGWSTTMRDMVSREEAYRVAEKAGQINEKAVLDWMKEQGLDTVFGTGEQLESSMFTQVKKFQAPEEALPLTHPEKEPVIFDPETIKGGKISKPASSYKEAATTGTNPYVRRSANAPDSVAPDNSNRQLMVQFASDLIYGAGKAEATGQDPVAGNYYDKLYSGARKGYARLNDFWEIPQWMGFGAHLFPNADVYVVRDMAQAKQFLKEAGYDRVLMSALDVNKSLVNDLLAGYEGKVDIGGYVDPKEVVKSPNITWHKNFESLAKAAGVEYRNGVDYRHFAGSDVIPRLTMSTGCKHKCAFCSVEKDLIPTPDAVVEQQAGAIAELGSKLVYLNDKTFGQAANYRNLERVNEIIKSKVPEFGGFIVQTTAAQMQKMPIDWLVKSGIRFVELGIETYNDPILKEMRKPATESLMDKAADKLREAGIALIPNIIIGFPQETPQTYARTLEWLKKNADNISHANIYNLAIYKEAELGKKLNLGDTGADFNENVLEKSWMTDPQVHRTFAGELYGLASSLLEGKPESTKFQAPEELPANVGKISDMTELWEKTPRVEKTGVAAAAATDLADRTVQEAARTSAALAARGAFQTPEAKEGRSQNEPSDATMREPQFAAPTAGTVKRTLTRAEREDIRDRLRTGELSVKDWLQALTGLDPGDTQSLTETAPTPVLEQAAKLAGAPAPAQSGNRRLEAMSSVRRWINEQRASAESPNRTGQRIFSDEDLRRTPVDRDTAIATSGQFAAPPEKPRELTLRKEDPWVNPEEAMIGNYWIAPDGKFYKTGGDHGQWANERLGGGLKGWQAEEALIDKGWTRFSASREGEDTVFINGARLSDKQRAALEKWKDVFPDVELVDSRSIFFTGPRFAAPKKKTDKKAFKVKPATISKAWIKPNGDPVQLGGQWHHDWLQANSKEAVERWWIPEKAIKSGDQQEMRVEALKKGFARVNLEANNGNITFELRADDLRKHKAAIADFVEANASAIDNINVTLFNPNVSKVADSDSAAVFRLDDKDKVNNIPFVTKFQAPKEEGALPGFEEATREKTREELREESFRPTVPTSEWGQMTQKEKREHFSEAIVPKSADTTLELDIKNAPLYKEAKSEAEAVELYSDRLVDFAKEYENEPEFKAGAKWYDELVPILKKTYGKDARIMAEFLAATSPQTNPTVNFGYAHDALMSLRSGRFDKKIKKFNEGLEKVATGKWEKEYARAVEAGEIKNPPKTPTGASFLGYWIAKHDLKPRSPHGPLYGISSDAVLQVAARVWLKDNQGPKTDNFVKNMIGESDEATIDIWATRTMQWAGWEGRAERWRALPEQNMGISNPDFYFSQKVFRRAAERLGMKPQQLQGALWFAEKLRWAQNGWSKLDLGSYTHEIKTKLPQVEARWRQRAALERAPGKKKTAEQLEILPK